MRRGPLELETIRLKKDGEPFVSPGRYYWRDRGRNKKIRTVPPYHLFER